MVFQTLLSLFKNMARLNLTGNVSFGLILSRPLAFRLYLATKGIALADMRLSESVPVWTFFPKPLGTKLRKA